MFYIPIVKSYIGTYHLFTEDELTYLDLFTPTYKKIYYTKELIETFPEAKSVFKTILKERIQEDNALLDRCLEIERECHNITYPLQGDKKSFWVDVCRMKMNKPDPDKTEQRIRRNSFLLSSLTIRRGARHGITDADIEQAKAVPIESLYEGRLYKTGATLKGHCVFHNEKTPSFYIYTRTNSFYCWGCNNGGSVVDFVMKKNNVKFLEAVKILLSWK